ncbi:MAG: LPS export ABC transporter periplasmic protein LptC [Halofilum sp. (in: g-proteobacteria)]|nr:LPS export ABC transporter periplasmic protein LptC [Halofilum sp. (in: g-proteobacteria)]
MSWLTRLSILVLFVLAASTFWWLDTTREPERDAAPTAAAEELPDYYFTAFRIERYTMPGPPAQVLRGQRLEHYPINNTADIEQPRVVHQPADAPLWRIRGDSGTLYENADLVELHGNVRLLRPASDSVRAFTLLTPSLTYAMQAEIARTEQAVQMRSPGTRVEATGMTARLAQGEVDLLHAVRVRHDPALTDGDATDG